MFTYHEILTISFINLLQLTLSISIYIHGPFFPAQAIEKGATASQYSIVFVCYQLSYLIFTPLFLNLVTKHSLKMIFSLGMITYSIPVFLIGFLQFVHGTLTFLTISCLLRTVEGIGAASGSIAATTLGVTLFPRRASFIFATLELSFGVGMILGPILGALLYTIGGFILPFVTVGLVSAIIAIASYFLISEMPEGATVKLERNTSVYDLFQYRKIVLVSGLVIISGIADSYLYTLLEEHLNKEFGVTVRDVGYIFALTGVAYSVAGFLCSLIIFKTKAHNIQVIVFGCVVTLVGYSVIGPAPYYPFKGNLAVSIGGMILYGIGTGFINIITFTSLLERTAEYGFPHHITTHALVSSIWLFCLHLGYFIGPSVAGVVFDNVGFSYGSLIVIILLISAIFISAMTEILRKSESIESSTPTYTGGSKI